MWSENLSSISSFGRRKKERSHKPDTSTPPSPEDTLSFPAVHVRQKTKSLLWPLTSYIHFKPLFQMYSTSPHRFNTVASWGSAVWKEREEELSRGWMLPGRHAELPISALDLCVLTCSLMLSCRSAWFHPLAEAPCMELENQNAGSRWTEIFMTELKVCSIRKTELGMKDKTNSLLTRKWDHSWVQGGCWYLGEATQAVFACSCPPAYLKASLCFLPLVQLKSNTVIAPPLAILHFQTHILSLLKTRQTK